MLRKITVLLLLALSVVGCKTEEQELAPLMCRLSSRFIVLEEGGASEFTFDVVPSSFITQAVRYHFSIHNVEEDGSCAAENTYCKYFVFAGTTNMGSGTPESITFKTRFRDLAVTDKYWEKVSVHLNCTYADGSVRILKSLPILVQGSGCELVALSFLQKENPGTVVDDVVTQVEGQDIHIASPYLASSKLAARFLSNGVKVYADGVLQTNGFSINDFSKPVEYKVVSAKGETKKYHVSVQWSGLPVLEITTPGQVEIPSKKEGWLPGASIRLLDTEGTIGYEGTAEVRGRGNSTWGFPKKPYTFRTPAPVKLLGMKEHRRWILLANWLDRTLIRNDVSFHLAHLTGLEWSPSGHYVELILNGKHRGNYYLCEQIKIDDDRLNLYEMPPDASDYPAISGGYIFEMDDHKNEQPLMMTPIAGLPLIAKDPDLLNSFQKEYVSGFFTDLESILYDDSRLLSGEYRTMLNVDSFVDWWLVYELTGNREPNHPKSVYMYKDRLKPLKAGPVWDFDWGTFRDGNKVVVNKALYYKRLFLDPFFVRKVKERWTALKPSFSQVQTYIRQRAAGLKESEKMNHKMWPNTRSVNGDEKLSYADAVERMIRIYNQRLETVDRFIAGL